VKSGSRVECDGGRRGKVGWDGVEWIGGGVETMVKEGEGKGWMYQRFGVELNGWGGDEGWSGER